MVFAGIGHFQGSKLNHYDAGKLSSIMERGLVDDALGIPVIAFDKRELGEGNFILRGKSVNGADFYLPAGHCYLDSHKLVQSSDELDKAISSNFPYDVIHGVKAIWSSLASIYLDKNNFSECTPKQATYVPVKPPSKPQLNK